MDSILSEFVGQCDRHPTAIYPLADFIRDFRRATSDQRPRGEIVAAMAAAGHAIGKRGLVACIGGLGPRGEWRAVNGALVLVVA